MSKGKNSSSQTRERRYSLLYLSEVNEEKAKGGGGIKTVKQSLLSMALKYIYVVGRHVPNLILEEIASHTFLLSHLPVKFFLC